MMGMGFNFITSPDRIKPPPPAARSCLESSHVPMVPPEEAIDETTDGNDATILLKPRRIRQEVKTSLRRTTLGNS